MRISHRLTNDEFLRRVYEKHRDNVQVLDRYIDANTKIRCRCNICGYEWSAKPHNLMGGKGCTVCGNKRQGDAKRKSHEDFLAELTIKHPNIIALSEYHGAFEMMRFQCLDCGFQWETQPHPLLRHAGCPECSKKHAAEVQKKSPEVFLQELAHINDTVEVLDEYKDSWSKVTAKCLICHNIWKTPPVSLLSGRGCPVCRSSKGERSIMSY